MERIVLALGLVLTLAAPVFGAECDPRQDSATCVLIQERDNALNDLANSEGARRDEVVARGKERAYWQRYVAGLPDVPKMRAKMAAACAWRGVESKPEAEMCAWYRRAFPAPQLPWSAKR